MTMIPVDIQPGDSRGPKGHLLVTLSGQPFLKCWRESGGSGWFLLMADGYIEDETMHVEDLNDLIAALTALANMGSNVGSAETIEDRALAARIEAAALVIADADGYEGATTVPHDVYRHQARKVLAAADHAARVANMGSEA